MNQISQHQEKPDLTKLANLRFVVDQSEQGVDCTVKPRFYGCQNTGDHNSHTEAGVCNITCHHHHDKKSHLAGGGGRGQYHFKGFGGTVFRVIGTPHSTEYFFYVHSVRSFILGPERPCRRRSRCKARQRGRRKTARCLQQARSASSRRPQRCSSR